MKKLLLKGIVLLAVTGTYTHASEGGADVGGGLGDEPTYQQPRSGSGSDSRTHYNTREQESYCHYTFSTLDRAVLRAGNLVSQQNWAVARATLIKGVQDALRYYNSWSWNYKPLTKEALQRAIELDRQFTNNCGGNSSGEICQADRRALRFLFGYLGHIKNTVIPFEIEYNIPSRRSSHYNWEIFASHYKDVAISLLEVYTGRGPDYQMPEAFGVDLYELRVASKLFAWASYDLRRDDYNRAYRCDIAELQYTSDLINEQLQYRDVFSSDSSAVKSVRQSARNTLSSLNQSSCYRRW